MESFADRLCINNEVPSGTIISPEPILECSKQGCDGGFPSTAWNWVIDNGGDTTCTSQCFKGCAPYDSGSGKSPKCHAGTCDSGANWPVQYQAASFKSLSGLFNHDLNLYQTELYNNGPLQACFTVYNNFYTFFSLHPKGIYTEKSGSYLGGHCVKMIGWGTDSGQDYWLFANSWDTTWADQGYFKMARGVNLCGIENQISEGFTKKQSTALNIPLGVAKDFNTSFIVGGWSRQQDFSDSMFTEAAEAGLAAVANKLHRDVVLKSILSAETQVVAGSNFKLVVKTEEGSTIAMKLFRDLEMNYHLKDYSLRF
jgi:cathepsin B